uniref:NADH-ubiquinone oxidoreductase chain 2 n=1 Tax=Paramecium tetraurelia TaxID=5888 RepID=NU2M_PARTE|nr:unnamed protein product [Paramecium aurelia]P15577.1 RecName: Full=NADH-ubiquinone oxidoreductase chain 2; AltName: Full=NADH dehydrogenase subunit 2 [Paramecium tetraurelia]AAA79255.1 NADH dehydrogenase subunit 2 [Paramecium aurelia]CAA34043.1 unnamed protein product [Paramecium aurelia]
MRAHLLHCELAFSFGKYFYSTSFLNLLMINLMFSKLGAIFFLNLALYLLALALFFFFLFNVKVALLKSVSQIYYFNNIFFFKFFVLIFFLNLAGIPPLLGFFLKFLIFFFLFFKTNLAFILIFLGFNMATLFFYLSTVKSFVNRKQASVLNSFNFFIRAELSFLYFFNFFYFFLFFAFFFLDSTFLIFLNLFF